MHRAFRRLVSLLLTISLVNGLAWSFSSDAMADWLTQEKTEMVADAAAVNSSPADTHRDEQTCNHGCHAASHLQGQVAASLPFFVPDTSVAVFVDESFFLPPGIAQRQFRPPRFFSQA